MDKTLVTRSTGMLLLKLIENEDMYGYQMIEELIVTDGTTLLGADDKAGVAEIMSAVERLMESGRPHGEVKVIFTTDEEVGRGAEGIDVKALGCDFGYTVDGGPIGEIEYENFNAASCTEAIAAVTVPAGVPVIAGEEGICKGCGLATLSINYYDLGRTTGEMAVKILKGEANISEMPVEYFQGPVKKFNKDMAEKLNVTIPDEYVAIED